MINLTDPGLTLAPSPAPALMQMFEVPKILGAQYDPDAFRRFVAALLRTYNGFGCGKITRGDKPPLGRPEAYSHLLFSFQGEDTNTVLDYADSTCKKYKSSCGLTVRSLWLLLGARHPLLNPPYRRKVMTYVRAYAILHGAYRGMEDTVIQTGRDDGLIAPNEGVDWNDKTIMPPHLTWDTFDPKPGDVLFLEYTQHMSTIVEIVTEKNADFVEFISCDGGQATPGDDPCCGISLIKRRVNRKGDRSTKSEMWGETFTDSSGKQVRGWADVTKLTFVANFTTTFRNMGRLDLPDPKPIGG